MSKNKWKFEIQSFAPDEKLKDPVSKMYMKQLKVFMKNKHVRNIAMTGDLGIGKSTLIRNYERKYPKSFSRKKYVYLSVTDMKVELDKENLQSELEERLLKQLLVICNKEEMIGSHYRPVPEKKIGLIPIILTIILSLFAAKKLECLPEIIDNAFVLIIFSIFCLFAIYYLIKKLCLHYKLPSFEFNFGGEKNNGNAAAEHTEAEETLDKNMTDIVYLMERIYKKSAKVLVVEDLDRYGADICIPIIEKLREINVLVNQRIRFLHGDREPFRFVYILKDDIFSQMMQDKNKPSASQYDIFSEMPQDENKSSVPPSKYFDGILPVVPQLGHANSADYLIGKREWNTKYNIEEDFIYDVSKYIYDYRQIRAIENEFNIFREVAKEKIKDESKINATELMAFCIYKHFYPEEYYKIRTQPEQELISYVFEKEINRILTILNKCFKNNPIKINEVKLPTDDRKKTLFDRITIGILRYIFPDNSINDVLDKIVSFSENMEYNKESDTYTISSKPNIFNKTKDVEKQLHKSNAYYIDFRLILAIYATLCISEDMNENFKIFDFQKKLFDDCDENIKNASGDNAKEKFAYYYALSMGVSSYKIFSPDIKIEIAEKIKTELLDKYPTNATAYYYTQTLANATNGMDIPDKILSIANTIENEFLKYSTSAIAYTYAIALYNAVVKITVPIQCETIAEKIKTKLLDIYQTPEIAYEYASTLGNTAFKMKETNRIEDIAEKIRTELLEFEKYQTPEIALIYAMTLVIATSKMSDPNEGIRLAEKIKTELLAFEKYQTPKIAEGYARALCNAAFKMTDTKKIVDIAEKIKTELLAYEKYQTPEIAEAYAMALCNAAFEMTDTKKIVDIAEKIKTEILAFEKYQTSEIAYCYAKALVNAAEKMSDIKKIRDIVAKIKELNEKYNTPIILGVYVDVLKIAQSKKSPSTPTP